jgi:hypothetical protein
MTMKARLFLAAGTALGVAALIPLPAKATPGVGSGTCTTSSSRPATPTGAKKVAIPGVPPGSAPGTAWAGGTTTYAGAGAYGSHGWIQGTYSKTSGVNVSGYSTDQGHLNGYFKANGTSTRSFCLGVNGKKVHS